MTVGIVKFLPQGQRIRSLLISVVSAEDEGEEEEEDDEDEGGGSQTTSKTEMKTVTTYVKLPDQIVKKQIVTTIYDSDGDGVFDDTDPTPTINDNLIVEDNNQDGIVDAYEQYQKK
ncbi:hypothetical protein EPO05_01615 [Patescibacteria group bacterium]|nr:MAG: hypothetical protein EPO05_01615 [Patescibacteria group bacterium]